MVTVFYSQDYVGSGYSFDTTRKAKWVADSLAGSPVEEIRLQAPEPLTREQVARVHDPEYIRAVETGEPRSLAESQGFVWDPGLWPMVLASNGGAVAAALIAMEHGVAGSLSSGLHHARRHCGAGFCTFNGLVIAAIEALDAGAQAVMVLDLDAHCGGGTKSLVENNSRIWQVDVSVDSFDCYGGSERCMLEIVKDAGSYLSLIERSLDATIQHGPPFGLCIYNAGMDPFESCSTGGLRGISQEILAEREKMVFAWCRNRKIPVAFVLAGGYVGPDLSQSELVRLHRLTLRAAAVR